MAPSDPPHGTTTGSPAGRSGVDTARDAVRDTARDLSDDASRIAEQAREGVRDGIAGARTEASRQAKRGIERTADEVSHTAHALETAAGEFDDGSLQHQLLHRAADGLSDLSGTLRGKSIDQIAGDLANFGRRNPAAFLGGAALVGFAVARFARASHAHGHDRGHDDGERRYGRYGGAQAPYGAGTMPQPQQPPSAHPPYGTSGVSTAPVAGPAATGTTTAGATSASPAAGSKPTSPATGSTGGGSAASLGAGQGVGSDPLNKGKPNV